MAAGMVSLRYFILGLLAQQPMSGYDIKRFLKSLDWLIGSPSGGSLYPILRALLQEELVAVEVVPGLDRPPRKIYSITQVGNHVLQTWIEQPIVANASLKAFVMRLLLADSLSRSGLMAHLKRRQAQVAAHYAALAEDAGAPNEGGKLGRSLALNYGLALANAELAWLGNALSRLSEQRPPEEGKQSEPATSIV